MTDYLFNKICFININSLDIITNNTKNTEIKHSRDQNNTKSENPNMTHNRTKKHIITQLVKQPDNKPVKKKKSKRSKRRKKPIKILSNIKNIHLSEIILDMTNNNDYYFETQSCAYCGMHSINNLFARQILVANRKSDALKINDKYNIYKIANNIREKHIEESGLNNENILYSSSGYFSIDLLSRILGDLDHENNIIFNYEDLINSIKRRELIGYILAKDNHYVAIRVKAYDNEVLRNLECDLSENNENVGDIEKLKCILIDSYNINGNNAKLYCYMLKELLFSEIINSNKRFKSDTGLIAVYEK